MNRTTGKFMMIAAMVTLCLGVTACSDDDGDAVDTGGTAAVGGTDVAIADYKFVPSPLTASVGDTVTWTNDDDFAHGTEGDADEWASGDVAPGDTFEFTFEEAGTFAYHCSIHNFMKGEIVVEG